MKQTEVIIIGGGLAGLTAAIHLRRDGIPVTLIEKNGYPHHKVCGEYLSGEVIPYLAWLDADPSSLTPISVSRLEFSTVSGKNIHVALPLGGIGISRFELDFFLYRKAVNLGCRVVQQQVTEISFEDGSFTIRTKDGKELSAPVVLGAFGKRSSLDVKLCRGFIQKRSPWLAIKMHYEGKHSSDLVGLHVFPGGYCGISMIENGIINICYLAQYNSFRKYKNIGEHQQKVLFRNPFLREAFCRSKQVFDQPLTISQVSFAQKEVVHNHMLMSGDSAGLIHPLCGNGMAMAIHSAKLASECILDFVHGKTSRKEMEHSYRSKWRVLFGKRLRTGRMIAWLLQYPFLTDLLAGILPRIPGAMQILIKKTHGSPIKIKEHDGQHKVTEYSA